MIHFHALNHAENNHAHLNALKLFHKHKDNPFVDDVLNILIADAKVELDKHLQRVHDELSRANIIGQTVVFDDEETLKVSYVTVWHIHGTTSGHVEIGIPICRTQWMKFADEEVEQEYTDRRKEQFRARIAAFQEKRRHAVNAAERRTLIEEEIVENMDEGFRKARDK